jgi:hypothetical protein
MSVIVTLIEADAYFSGNRLNADAWDITGTEQQKALNMAENMLGAVYSLDAANDQHKIAVFEQALFELQNAGGADKRAALQAMGVESAGVVQEVYKRYGIFICAYAATVLSDSFINGPATVKSWQLERDETDTAR